MCLHESIGLSQDGEQLLLCWGCGREFGRLGRDEDETFIATVAPDNPVVVVAPKKDHGFGFTQTSYAMRLTEIYPCAKCEWAFSCDDEDGGCHT